MLSLISLIHKISVSLFLLSYIIRLVGMLGNIAAIQNLYAKKSMRMLVDMLISTVFLVTGVYLLLQLPSAMIGKFLIIKIVLVLISIPVAIIGFKKGNKMLAILSVLLLIGAYGLGEMNKKNPPMQDMVVNAAQSDTDLFTAANCATCHGAGGNQPMAGVKNLTQSQLSSDEVRNMIVKGKNVMPGYGKKLSPAQIDQLVNYVMTLRVSK